jgi:hypothetical protein
VPTEAPVGRWDKACDLRLSLERAPPLRRGLGSSPFPLVAIPTNCRCVELAGGPVFPQVIDGDDNLLACKTSATQNSTDCDFALFISLNRYVVRDLPLTNGANG